MEVSEVCAVVTGGASGLGAATAEAFRAAGARVTICDRAAEGAAFAAAIGATFAATDVTDETSATAAIETARSAMGRIDVLVNCAGIATGARIVGRDGPHDLGAFRRTIDVNLVGSFNMMRLAAAAMAANPGPERGVIVNTASIAAFDGQKGQAAYAASKGGVAALTLPAARELARFGIRVMTIAPGLFETAMSAGLPPEARAALEAGLPFPSRMGRPDEYAMLVQQIVENPLLNGEVIRIDSAVRLAPK